MVGCLVGGRKTTWAHAAESRELVPGRQQGRHPGGRLHDSMQKPPSGFPTAYQPTKHGAAPAPHCVAQLSPPPAACNPRLSDVDLRRAQEQLVELFWIGIGCRRR